MKTKLTTLALILVASITHAGQPAISAAQLAKNSRKLTAAEMQNKGSGYIAYGACRVVEKAINRGATTLKVNLNCKQYK